MRILHAYKVYRPDINGGIPEVISQLAGLSSGGDTVDILVARHKGPSRRFRADGADVTAVASLGNLMSMPISPGFPWALKRAASQCDVLALHMPFPLNDMGLYLGIPDRVAVVLHWHAEIMGRGLVMPAILPLVRRTLARADKIIVSDRTIIDGSSLLRPHAAKCMVIPFGIDVDYWSDLDELQSQQAATLRERHPRLVVAAGRLVPYKGLPILLRAMTEVDADLIVIGEGDEREPLMRLAQELGLAGRVTFKGYLPKDAIKTHFHAAKVFVLPSISNAEAFGIVQIEAMACGLPIVNMKLPTAVPHIARNEHEGITVEPGNPGKLAAALNELISDSAKAAQLGAAARMRCKTEYARPAFLSRVRNVYSEALAKRRTVA